MSVINTNQLKSALERLCLVVPSEQPCRCWKTCDGALQKAIWS